jgi:hypothetical protein
MALPGPPAVTVGGDIGSSSGDVVAGPETPKRGLDGSSSRDKSPDSSSSNGSSSLAAPDKALQQSATAPAVGNSSSSSAAAAASTPSASDNALQQAITAPTAAGSSSSSSKKDEPDAQLQQAITAALASLTAPQRGIMLDEAPQRLRQAAAWPRDVLAAAAVRNAASPEDQSSAEALQEVVVKYLLRDLDAGDETAAAAAAAAAEGQLSDVAQMALQPPLPLDAFVEPQVWLLRQQQLLALDRRCDHCGSEATTADQVGGCPWHRFCSCFQCFCCCWEQCRQCCCVVRCMLFAGCWVVPLCGVACARWLPAATNISMLLLLLLLLLFLTFWLQLTGCVDCDCAVYCSEGCLQLPPAQ